MEKEIVRNGSVQSREIADLRQAVGWDKAEDAYERTLSKLFAYYTMRGEDDQLLGYMSVLSDGVADALLVDLAIHPKSQGDGLGTRMVRRAIRDLQEAGVRCVQVTFSGNLESFYARCGFEICRGGIIDFQNMNWNENAGTPALAGDRSPEYQEIIAFHGHDCPGLAIGYRMATAALDALRSMRAQDEEVVAIVENDACGVDALQCVTGCTFGKGNLRFHDYGKQVYTLYSRTIRQGVRVLFHGRGASAELRENREAFTKWVLTAPLAELVSVARVTIDEPAPARIRRSEPCAICGENVMENRLREHDGEKVCQPCLKKV